MFRVLLASALLAGIFIGCQRENGPTVPIDTVYRLSLTAEPDTISDNPSSYSTITATLIDQSGHPVGRGVPVNFTANFGTIASTAFTDDNGRAATLFLPDRTLGMVKITASMPTVDKLPVEDDVRVCVVDAGMPVSIRLTAAPPLISVRGVGGTETSALTAEVLNAIGEPVDEEKTVIIDLLREPPLPQGGQIDGHGQRDSTRTVEGIARAGLNAGTQIGAKLVRVYTWRDNNRRDTVSVTASPVAVISGPPFQLDVDVNDKAVNAGGGAWICEVSARVWDIHRNPVANNIPVVFTVDPQIATISAGLTGNRSRAWNSIPGVAFADLIYHSVNTFDEITISAEVHTTGGMITGTREHKLPLQRGYMELYCDPGNFMFDRNNFNLTCNIRVTAILKDGHGILINSAPVRFTTDRAKFYWYNQQTRQYVDFSPEIVRRYTGLVDARNNEPRGTATVYLRGVMDDFYLDPFTLETVVQINAEVEGYGDVAADPVFVRMIRH